MAWLGTRFEPQMIPLLSVAVVDFSVSGDNTIIAGVASQTIRLHRLVLVTSGATNLTFKDGSVAFTGSMAMAANGAFIYDENAEPWNKPTAGQGLVFNSSVAVQIGGTAYYTQS